MKTYTDLDQWGFNEPRNPLSGHLQKWIEREFRIFYGNRMHTYEEVQAEIYRIAIKYDTMPGKVRVIHDRTRRRGYERSEQPRPL